MSNYIKKDTPSQQPARRVAASQIAGVTLFACLFSAAEGAPINYGDFSDIPPGSVIYQDVQESSGSLGDEPPLFGVPGIVANSLTFTPSGQFRAVSRKASKDITEGTLQFDLKGLKSALTKLTFNIQGDYELSAPSASAHYGMDAFATVFAIDGNPVSSPLVLPIQQVQGSSPRRSYSGADTWNLDMEFDVSAALTDLGVGHEYGATHLGLVVNHSLQAKSDVSSIGAVSILESSLDAFTRSLGDSECGPINALLGDLDGNNEVAFADFLKLSTNFGKHVNQYSDGDIDCDGVVGFSDFLELSSNFGNKLGSKVSSVPEPSCLAMAFLGVGLLGMRRKGRSAAKKHALYA